jgi:serine/threonine protein phosphatase PrpC
VSWGTRIDERIKTRGEDRVAVVSLVDRTVIVVADGAGGTGGGAAAAQAVCDAVVQSCAVVPPPSWEAWLANLDAQLPRAGQAAAVIVEVRHGRGITGASVGDCEAWIFAGAQKVELTENQVRKPLLGEARSHPIGFESDATGLLVVATDGLWKYAKRERVVDALAIRPLDAALTALVDATRLRSGALQDDVAIAICDVEATRQR